MTVSNLEVDELEFPEVAFCPGFRPLPSSLRDGDAAAAKPPDLEPEGKGAFLAVHPQG